MLFSPKCWVFLSLSLTPILDQGICMRYSFAFLDMILLYGEIASFQTESYPLVMTNIATLKIAIEIVDLHIKKLWLSIEIVDLHIKNCDFP